ncbi:Hypothetical protein NCS54_01457400 [Fusarium falciforme]|uniref:Hypothetical protein n=1 Tax=Fusarium falciforme TaxID=195108 RepID=UPI0023007172|nr:Hypothetical protein NCS54_01457400 [Fusarium falciforme]WAO96883.1 Hypothetical protein NCS54_01457400 [Fusarium falciforme]
MASATFANVSSRPAAWTLGQPSSALPVEAVVDSTTFTSTESNSTGFTSSGFTSAGFQKLSSSFTDKDGLSSVDSTLLQDAGMIRSIVKIESRFENTQTGHSIWKIGTGWLIRPDLIVTGGDVVYDAEYQLGAATQVKCFIGYHASSSSEIQPRYGQRVVTSSEWIDGSEKRSRDIAFIQVAEPFAIKGCTCKALEQVRLPEPEIAPKAPIQEEPVVSESKENATTTTEYYSSSGGACGETDVAVPQVEQPKPQPEVTQPEVIQPEVIQPQEPELKIPSVSVHAKTDDDGFVNVTSPAADTTTDPFYEVLKTVAQIDTKTLDIESPLVDEIGQFLSVSAGSLLRYVVGAEPISTGQKTRLPGVSERALLAEASLQAVLAIEQSSELNEIVEHMRQTWSANAPEVDQAATLIVPYLKERAQHIAEYHLEDANEQTVESKKLKRRPLAIRLSAGNEGSKDFAKGLFSPTIPLAGREQVFSSLGPVLRDAILAVETLVSETGKAAINERVPKLLEKSRTVNSTQSDLEATRILIQRAIMADAAYQALASLSEQKLQALKLLPLGSTAIEHESIFDFIKRVIQKTGPVALHPTKQAVKKFIPLLIDTPSKQPEPATGVTTKTTVHRLALRDVLREDKASANVGIS